MISAGKRIPYLTFLGWYKSLLQFSIWIPKSQSSGWYMCAHWYINPILIGSQTLWSQQVWISPDGLHSLCCKCPWTYTPKSAVSHTRSFVVGWTFTWFSTYPTYWQRSNTVFWCSKHYACIRSRQTQTSRQCHKCVQTNAPIPYFLWPHCGP